jgi:DNA helicase HerA-like ATPase
VFGIVSNMRSGGPSGQARSLAEVDFLGEAGRYDPAGFSFTRGVASHPTLGDPVHRASISDIFHIYAPPARVTAEIGNLHQDPAMNAFALIDELLGKHFAIVGSSGAGKSCAMTVLLRSVLRAHPCGHVILFDPHDEYPAAFADMAEVVTPENLDLPYWMLNFEELKEFICSEEPSEKETEAAILRQALVVAKREYQESAGEKLQVKVDTPVPYWISRLEALIREDMGRLDKPRDAMPYLRLQSRLKALQGDRRFAFMFSGALVRDTMPAVLARLLRMPVAGKPVTVLCLAGLPSEIVDLIVSLICRLVFEFSVWRRPGPTCPCSSSARRPTATFRARPRTPSPRCARPSPASPRRDASTASRSA